MNKITMEQLGLSEAVLKAVQEIGFEHPTPVQEEVIPVLSKEYTDLVALAQTGTGKTAAYGLPVIERILVDDKYSQALVLSPTRELCIQITRDLKTYAKYINGLKIEAVYGGADITKQIKALQKGVHIIVATPGRMLDLMNRGKVDISTIHTLILDEADEMLNMGFQEDLNAILSKTPDTKNTWLFSATMPREAERIAQSYMHEPRKITVGKRNAGAENVEHIFYMVQAKDRYLALKRIADINPDIYGIIFCRTRAETKDIAHKLIQDGYDADALHGDLTQAQRDNVMHKFRIKNLQMLVATDVAARGLDVNNLSHIINVDLPDDLEIYTHRSGRTGRAGKTGISISIIHSRERGKLRRIEEIIGKKFEQRPVPSGKDICEKQLFHLIGKMENVEVNHEQIDPYLPIIYKKLERMEKEDLIKNFVALEFNRFLEYYKNAKDLNTVSTAPERMPRSRSQRPERSRTSFKRLFIDLGKKNDVAAGDLIGLVNRYNRDRKVEIGKIEVLKTFSFLEVEASSADAVLKSLRGATYKKRSVNIEIAQSNYDENKETFSKRRDFKRDKKRHFKR